jgi:hypothetical protein
MSQELSMSGILFTSTPNIQAASSFDMLELSCSTVRFQNPEIHKLDALLYFYFEITGGG